MLDLINMKIYLLISLGIQLLTSSCNEKVSTNVKEDANVQSDSFYAKNTVEAFSNKDSLGEVLDTASLYNFWTTFKKDIQADNKEYIVNVLEYPVRAYHLVLFQYAHDCDTTTFIKNEKEYYNLDINQTNVYEYYDFIFTDVLKKIIQQTSFEDLISKGIKEKGKPWLTYRFFPKDYDVQVNCSNDHLLMFYISEENDGWKIGIGGL